MKKIILFLITASLTINLYSQIIEESKIMRRLAEHAESLTKDQVTYVSAYHKIKYPMGDIPANIGCCVDVIIRAYRKVGIDLQQLVHEDMRDNFDEYPKIWGLTQTDTNIDHRRVPNLMKFFERNGDTREINKDPGNYHPGDVVCWDLGSVKHIGMVSTVKSKEDPNRYLIVHNIGNGQVLEDCLFTWKIIGHYMYYTKR